MAVVTVQVDATSTLRTFTSVPNALRKLSVQPKGILSFNATGSLAAHGASDQTLLWITENFPAGMAFAQDGFQLILNSTTTVMGANAYATTDLWYGRASDNGNASESYEIHGNPLYTSPAGTAGWTTANIYTMDHPISGLIEQSKNSSLLGQPPQRVTFVPNLAASQPIINYEFNSRFLVFDQIQAEEPYLHAQTAIRANS